ncbi:LuxR C-terminal-related transcriptional regulator [Halalkalibacter oceani]|uniref:LuxR C-terminal-related transcriptional regulator n=1 Tax=Halalkalibacter oceani TaxID=1653776 RepID=UPI00339A4EEE
MTNQIQPTILKTKITLPVPKDSSVLRSRLLDTLNAGSKGRLTIVTAPAGFGKTTLLTQWADSNSLPCVWLSLDEMDNDTVRFWRYILHAIASVLPQLNREHIYNLERALSGSSIYSFLDSLINELFASSEEIAILIDDYHIINDAHIHDSITYFIHYLPSTIHMIISSRKELPFSTAKWTVQNEVSSIDMEQLQFTLDEAELFYTNVNELELSHQQIGKLHEQTGGWAAGLQLVTLSIRSKTDYDHFIQEFNGDHRNVSDFLFQEVMSGLPDELYTFLLDSSVLSRMNAPIIDTITNRSNSRDMLEMIKQLNLFLIPLDDQNRWFRYHHLFAQFLQGMFKKNSPEGWLRANRLASECLASYGFMDDAIHHALEAQDFELTQEYLAQHLPDVLRKGEHKTLHRWFQRIPDETLLIPEMSLLYAFVLLLNRDFLEADRLLDTLEQTSSSIDKPSRKGQLESGILFVRANLMFLNGDFKKWLKFVEGIQDRILPENAVFYNYNYNLSEPLVRRTPLGLKGVLSADTDTIGRMFNEILESHGWTQSLINLYVKQSLCEGYYEWNELDKSRKLLNEVERNTLQMPVPGLFIPLVIMQARFHIVDQNFDLAHERIRDAIQSTSEAHWLRLLHAFQIRLYLLEGRLIQAKKEAEKLGLTAEAYPAFNQEYANIALVRLLGKQRKEAEALRLLERMKPQAAREQLISSLVEISALQSLLEYQRGLKDKATQHIHEALMLGEQNRYVRSFLDDGADMKAVLMHYLKVKQHEPSMFPSSEVTENYVHQLVASFPKEIMSQKQHKEELAEPLNRNEINLLRLLNQGATNKQMAEELALSPGTVRVYLSRLYEKLGVSSRTQALIAARNLELLE